MRIKRGQQKNAKHKKVLSKTKGYRMSYSKLYKRAKEAVLHAGEYSFAHRKKRKNDFRRLWITKISSALEEFDMNYSTFIKLLTKNKIELNRKMLSQLSEERPESFKEIVESLKK